MQELSVRKGNNQAVWDLPEFYGVQRLGDLRWAHMVNAGEELVGVLKADEHQAIEGDARFLNGQVVMNHDELIEELIDGEDYLSFVDWFKLVAESNNMVKIDFKAPEAVEPTLEIVRKINIDLGARLFLHADVIKGFGGKEIAFDAEKFIKQSHEFSEKAVVSLGFTEDIENGEGEYTEKMISAMTELASEAFPVVVCFRLSLLNPETDIIGELIKERIPLYLWGHEDDLTKEQWRGKLNLIETLRECAFVDLPFSLE